MPRISRRSAGSRINWPDYTSANGTTWPALGNLDADPLAELVVGFGQWGLGSMAVYDGPVGPTTPLTFVKWLYVDWDPYRFAVGETHPAIGNLDADAAGEIVVGLGASTQTSNAGGWYCVIDDGLPVPPFTYYPWHRVDHLPIQQQGTGTWPAIGRIR